MFQNPVDVSNLALQFLGLPRIDTTLGFAEDSQRSQEMASAYDKIKKTELRRAVYPWAIRKAVLRPMDINVMIVNPALWVSGMTYFRGSIVSDQNNFLWISRIPNNVGNQPQNTSLWEPYFGPLAVTLYTSTQVYMAGELVYTSPGDGTYNVYMSLVSNNGIDPSLPNLWSSAATYFQNNVVQTYPAWAVGTTYGTGATVLYTDGNYYASLVAGNIGNIPPAVRSKWALVPILQLFPSLTGATPQFGQPIATQVSPVGEWIPSQVYSLGSFVLFNGAEYVSLANSNSGNTPGGVQWAALSGGTTYMSLIDLNINQPPATKPAAWSNMFIQGGGNQQWTQIGGAAFPNGVALASPNIVYPLGSGPSSQAQTRNIFRLPSGYLRQAPQDPKAGSTSWLGAPSGLWYNDWNYEGSYIISRQTGPITFRFVADVTDVTQFDDMFCAGLAYRLALSTGPILTNNASIEQIVAQAYKVFMGEARIVSGIEIGAVEPAEDDFVIARL